MPIVEVRDDFGGAGVLAGRAPDIGPNWSLVSGPDFSSISSGAAVLTGGTDPRPSYAVGNPRSANYHVEADVEGVGPNYGVKMLARWSSSGTYGIGYAVDLSIIAGVNQSWTLQRLNTEAITTLDAGTTLSGLRHIHRLTCIGDKITVHVDGVLMTTVIDATIADGSPGINRPGGGGSVKFHQFIVIDLTNPIRLIG